LWCLFFEWFDMIFWYLFQGCLWVSLSLFFHLDITRHLAVFYWNIGEYPFISIIRYFSCSCLVIYCTVLYVCERVLIFSSCEKYDWSIMAYPIGKLDDEKRGRRIRVMEFDATFNNIAVQSFYWWGKSDYSEKTPTCRKSLTNFII